MHNNFEQVKFLQINFQVQIKLLLIIFYNNVTYTNVLFFVLYDKYMHKFTYISQHKPLEIK